MNNELNSIQITLSDKSLNDLALRLVPFLKEIMNNESDVISQNKAYKRYGQANVMRWVKKGLIRPVAKRPGKIEYSIHDLRICQSRIQDYF